jgi:hypothetical protein
MIVIRGILLGLLALSSVQVAGAEMLNFGDRDSWRTWDMPFGLVEFGETGQLQLKKFHKNVDVVADADQFSYKSVTRDVVSGGVWEALSNPATANRVIDGDRSTYWQPDPNDAVQDWAIEIDLGRAVLAKELRLHFPDQEGARPIRQFTVYAATGLLLTPSADSFQYEPIFRTTKPNRETVITIPLSYTTKDSVLVLDPGLDVDREELNRYKLFQRIRILVEEKNADAALAEIEIVGVGDNISLGTLERGSFAAGLGVAGAPFLFDGDMNTRSVITGLGGGGGTISGWEEAGLWFGVDLGAVFFIDDIFLYAFSPDEGSLGYIVNGLTGSGHQILFSEGREALQTTLPVPQALDYDELLIHDLPNADGIAYLRYHFRPRKIRYMFWRALHVDGWGWSTKWPELMLFSPGYPAEVKVKSSFIDLGTEAGDDRPKVIKALHWDADLPVSTQLQLRSRSGNNLAPFYTFFDRKGEEVSEDKWKSSPVVLRGPVDTALVVSEDWGAWSNEYQLSGEPFKSESPRRFVQLEMILSTTDPDFAPTVDMLSIEYEDALVQGALGSIAPRTTRPNEETRFTYTLWPSMEAGDSGFDVLRFTVPGRVENNGVELHIGGELVVPLGVEQLGDSLLVRLPNSITQDSVQVQFNARLVENATVFTLDLGQSERPGLWQSVEPAARRSNLVMLPDLPASGRLIGDLSLSSPVVTPNGDGVNDAVEVSFIVLKATNAVPKIEVFDLSGRVVTELSAEADGLARRFSWSGRNAAGQVVAPGLYLFRIDLGTQSGEDTALHSLSVAY